MASLVSTQATCIKSFALPRFPSLTSLLSSTIMNSFIIFSFCLLAMTMAMPDMTPQQRAQYDSMKAQAVSRLSSSGQQAQMRLDAMDQQIESYYQSLPQSTRNELDSFHNQMKMATRSIFGSTMGGFF
ncbi:hypothetical protein PRIPAC_79219 [Pristionchus pacificus]|uniref:Uncharacterized protein n=1 Tax=Pristionchus pacificus TaxID=54126 RepID=A0A2A6C2P0_PRIPA|nr:hypothetical protein PRIPAC_79219 [Pristionchus pacificus]|eukprot:PDM72368.1 hypothetical protein PRIPAC_38802 [Pristionchus pacificus]